MIKLINIEDVFYDFYNKTISIRTFETWLYENSEIETLIGSELYFELLDIDYRSKYAFLEVNKLILPHINFGRNETQRLIGLLKSIVDGEGDIYAIMFQLYYDYCHGYPFLIYLGLSFVTSGFEEEIGVEGVRNNLLLSISKYKQEANKLISSLEKGEIIITDEFEYEDYRKHEEIRYYNREEKAASNQTQPICESTIKIEYAA